MADATTNPPANPAAPPAAQGSSAAPPPPPNLTGLSSDDARARLAQFGPNDPTPKGRSSGLRQIFLLIANPLIIILLVASVVSIFVGDKVDAGIIIVIVVLGVAVNFLQTYRSEQAIKRLRDQVAPMATVLRDGNWKDVPRVEVVPDDLVRLSAGDLIPADGVVLAARDLFIQQAALTGESLPTEKDAGADDPAQHKNPSAANMVFLGTSVVSGSGAVRIFATGKNTSFGDIAARLAEAPEETEFEKGLRRFSNLLLRVIVFMVLFILVMSLALRHNAFQSLLFAVALAVGLTPEFLPMITTVILASGAIRMAKQKVIVKHLAAIQNFGSIDVFCSDKTGTLTAGRMTLESSVDPAGKDSEWVRTLGYINSKYETGIRSPLDAAIMEHACPAADGYEKRDEIPFDFERRRVSVIVERKIDGGVERLLVAKGSPEGLLPLCTEQQSGPSQETMDAAATRTCTDTYQELSRKGFRVLAVAFAKVPEQAKYSKDDEKALVLAGFLAFSDPILPDTIAALGELKRDGVQVKILTGDNELVARHVCEQVGLDASHVVLGEELQTTIDSALGAVIENATVFARVSPAQKHRIILELKQRGHVVGYMGDGINDAPSLHSADVGISVPSAVDVARDAADIILVEPGLGVLHRGILEGRKASGNAMKYLLMDTSSNFGNMVSMAAASVFLPFLPMLPTQILLNNFLYDLSQVTIPTDNVDEEYITKPQRWDMRLIRNFMLFLGPISSIFDFITFYVMLHFLHAAEPEFHTGWFVESLATQTLVLFVIRTMRNPFRSRPSSPLTIATLAIVVIGVVLPFTPLAGPLGFTPLPGIFYLFLAGATAAYLGLVEIGKRILVAHQLRA
ncbi:MAG TPA: magnesium-translocating P-type ATPase [Candidatus Acidoferrales bacterium]|jgi:Mg2+-importing ATPase|nr:magnesium-translocating P-type ATPase [Candidatus Acidoferrales bacterium]